MACKPWPYQPPYRPTEGSQRGLQGHQRGSWPWIGGQQSYQAYAKARP